jgi:hypothetical protein
MEPATLFTQYTKLYIFTAFSTLKLLVCGNDVVLPV